MVKQINLNESDVQDSAIDFFDSFINIITTCQCSKDISTGGENHWQQMHADSLEFLKTPGQGDFDSVFKAS